MYKNSVRNSVDAKDRDVNKGVNYRYLTQNLRGDREEFVPEGRHQHLVNCC